MTLFGPKMVKPDQQVCDPAALPTEIQQKSGGGGGWGGGLQAAGKLKGFFYLFLNQLSTMQEIIAGDKTGGGRAKEERRRVNIAARCRTNIRLQVKVSLSAQEPGGNCRLGCSPQPLTHQSIRTFRSRRPSLRGRESAETLISFHPVARHNPQAHPGKRQREVARSPERTGAPARLRLGRSGRSTCCLPQEQMAPLQTWRRAARKEHPKNEGRREPTGSFGIFVTSKG